ncbi:hypothetical protein AAVH_39291, partial [Aphelenchoides avenae]
VYLVLASIWFFIRDVQFFYWLRKNRIEEMACKTCYAKGVYSFFQQSIFYLFIVISMVGYAYVAAQSCEPGPAALIRDSQLLR